MPKKTQDVLSVANELYQSGIYPTNMAVRKRLGGGSYSTINEGLKKWRSNQQHKRSQGDQELAVAVETFIDISAIKKVASEFARKEFDGERDVAQKQINGLEEDLQVAAIQNENLERFLQEERHKVNELQKQVESQKVKIGALEERVENMVTHERSLIHRLDVAVESKAKVELSLIACEENTKLLKEQISKQQAEIARLETADETVDSTEGIFSHLLKRLNQAARLIDRLKYDVKRNDDRKVALAHTVAEMQALIERCYPGGLGRKSRDGVTVK